MVAMVPSDIAFSLIFIPFLYIANPHPALVCWFILITEPSVYTFSVLMLTSLYSLSTCMLYFMFIFVLIVLSLSFISDVLTNSSIFLVRLCECVSNCLLGLGLI